MSDTQNVIQPIDHYIFAGFAQRFQQVFECKCAFINANDKTRILERLFGQGQPLQYPYAYFVVQSISANHDSYNPHRWVRRGLEINVNTQGTVQTARIIPVNFEIEVTYVTNQFDSAIPGSVLSYARRWFLARRAGYLKTSINYGRVQLSINTLLDENLPIPQRENIVEQETKFDIVGRITLNGYMNDYTLGSKGVVNKVVITETVGGSTAPQGQVISSKFVSF